VPLYSSIETATGPISFLTDGERVTEIRLGAELHDRGRRTALDRETRRQLAEYFGGQRVEFDLPFVVTGTRFARDVLTSVTDIPFGATVSYGELADRVGRPRAARAVGNAVGSNALPLLVPCHRVLAAHDHIGGFGGGLSWKRFLLDLEGVAYVDEA